jgi:hypothetical protein
LTSKRAGAPQWQRGGFQTFGAKVSIIRSISAFDSSRLV